MDESSPYFWEDLLQFIEERSVIPIVGQELLLLEIGSEKISLDCYLARQLAEHLRIPTADLPSGCSTNQVACQFLRQPGARREDLYRRINAIMSGLAKQPPPTPEALRKLAQITHFQFFVTTSFDFFLEQAVNEVRFNGLPKTEVFVYTLNDCRDLPCELQRLTKPAIFHLFGRYSAQPNYAVTEEDTLEFVHHLQSESRKPRLLFDELKNYHIILLGASYQNWLSRFFLRTLRNERLTLPKGTDSYIADSLIRQDTNLSFFYSSPLSYGTKVFRDGSAADFVNELHSRWSAANPEPQTDAAPAQNEMGKVSETAAALARDGMVMAEGTVFLSYASEDFNHVRDIKTALESAGLGVWFDKKNLEAGDDYDAKIQRNIRKCSLFVPFISRNTERRAEGYFRREWYYAIDRARSIDPSIPFILPVVIDDTPLHGRLVPEVFKRLHWSQISGNFKDFVENCVRHFRSYQKRCRGY